MLPLLSPLGLGSSFAPQLRSLFFSGWGLLNSVGGGGAAGSEEGAKQRRRRRRRRTKPESKLFEDASLARPLPRSLARGGAEGAQVLKASAIAISACDGGGGGGKRGAAETGGDFVWSGAEVSFISREDFRGGAMTHRATSASRDIATRRVSA